MRSGIKSAGIGSALLQALLITALVIPPNIAFADRDRSAQAGNKNADHQVNHNARGKARWQQPVIPGEDDPSRFTGPLIEDLPDGLPEANQGTFEGGATGTHHDAEANNTVPPELQRDAGKFNIPTNGAPSPMFGAEPFTQQFLRFEEFGLDWLKRKQNFDPSSLSSLPMPDNAQSMPDGRNLERFLSQPIHPMPTVLANTGDLNPWQSEIEQYLGRTLEARPVFGRLFRREVNMLRRLAGSSV